MNRRPLFALLTALAVGAGGAHGQAPPAKAGSKDRARAQPKVQPKAPPRAELDKLRNAVKKDGKLKGADYWGRAAALQGPRRTLAAAPLRKGAKAPALRSTNKGSSLTVVGEPPEGFGKGFTWDRADEEALLVIFINAADPLGVSIDGMKSGDQIQVMSATGIASFSEDKGNPLASSLVGLAAAGANVALGAAGHPEVKPLIDAAEAFAKEQFKATNAKTKRRDAFGVDPTSRHKARQEGGLLVCLPEAGGIFYSGDPKEAWIQGDGARTDDRRPGHIGSNGFFPIQGSQSHNTRTVQADGQMYVTAWDHKFEDNAGYYKAFVKLKKGSGPAPTPVPLIKKGAVGKPKP